MSNFLKLGTVDVLPLLFEVKKQPELWNRNPCRLSRNAPHHETQDMFLRYRDDTPFIKSNEWSKFVDKDIEDWNKTIDFLPSAKPVIFDVMSRVQGEMLGGVFIYKLQPGSKIYPHEDHGWHPEFYDKFNICLQSNSKAAFCYDGEAMFQEQGDIHFFKNDVKHWVVNEGEIDHIVMTVCVRTDRGFRVPWSPEGWSRDMLNLRIVSCL